MFRYKLLTALAVIALCTPAFAHEGRRFEVKVIDGKLYAHGFNTQGVDDGAGVQRSYFNALHDHFDNSETLTVFASSAQPSYDIGPDATELIGYNLQWTATGFMKWSSPAMSGPVSLSPLEAGELLAIVNGGDIIRSDTYDNGGPATTTLAPLYNGANGTDLHLSYQYNGDAFPSGEIFVIKSILSTSAPGVEDSDTIYTLLSPDGNSPMEKLHHHSLHLEKTLGTPVPEPLGLGAVALLPLLMRRRRD